jgi:hypothetical protein
VRNSSGSLAIFAAICRVVCFPQRGPGKNFCAPYHFRRLWIVLPSVGVRELGRFVPRSYQTLLPELGLGPAWASGPSFFDERRISEILRSLAAEHLNSQEIAAGLADVRRDDTGGNRIALTAGQSPHYVAGLFRSDELAKENKRSLKTYCRKPPAVNPYPIATAWRYSPLRAALSEKSCNNN